MEVPKLGSFKDRILRDFLLKQASKEVAKQRAVVLALIGIIGSNNGSKQSIDQIINNWSNYVNLEYYMESVIEEREQDMREQYKTWQKVRPKVVLKKNDKGDVAMAISVSSLTPKIEE